MDELRPARRFAALSVAGLLPVFAIPIFLKPYAWARAFGWRAEPETDIGLYFGRCLGAVATAGCVQAVMAARDPQRHRSFFVYVEAASWLLAAAHLRGALEKRQPPIETAEIAMWSTLAVLARRARPPG